MSDSKFFSLLIGIASAFLIWFYLFLFHYDHKYKIVNKSHISGIMFSDNPYDISDKVVVINREGEYFIAPDDYRSKNADTVTITKILR